jgi:hypothetical protein
MGEDKGLRGVVSSTISNHMELIRKPAIQALMTEFNGLALGILLNRRTSIGGASNRLGIGPAVGEVSAMSEDQQAPVRLVDSPGVKLERDMVLGSLGRPSPVSELRSDPPLLRGSKIPLRIRSEIIARYTAQRISRSALWPLFFGVACPLSPGVGSLCYHSFCLVSC